MLFLGLGTGLGSALVADRVVVSVELGSLPFDAEKSMADHLGNQAMERNGKEVWLGDVERAAEILRIAMSADYVILGGGNAAEVNPLPPSTRRGHNDDAFTGGFRLWQEPFELHVSRPQCPWRVVG